MQWSILKYTGIKQRKPINDRFFCTTLVANFVGWRHKSRNSTPCNWNTWRFWLFCCYFRHGRQSLPAHGTLIVFQDKHLWFVGPLRFWSHTSLVTSVVYSSAFAVPVGSTYNILYLKVQICNTISVFKMIYIMSFDVLSICSRKKKI